MHSWVFPVAQLCGACPRRGHGKQNQLLVRVEDLLVCFCFCPHESSSPQGGRIGSSVPLVNHAFILLGEGLFFLYNLTGAWMKTTYGSSFSSPFCSPRHLSLHFCCMCRWVCDVRDFSNREEGGGEANGDQPAHVERHGCSLMWLQLRSPGPNEVPWRLGCSSSHRLRTSSPHTATAQDH